MEKTLNFEFFVISFNGFCIYFLLELLLQEILLIVRNFFHSKESDSFITLVYTRIVYSAFWYVFLLTCLPNALPMHVLKYSAL